MKPENYPWITPCLIVEDILKASDFYTNALKFDLIEEPVKNPKGEFVHALLNYNNSHIILTTKNSAYAAISMKFPDTPQEKPFMSLYIYCENTKDVDKLYKHALDFGAVSITKPLDTIWGDRVAIIKDIHGYQWGIASKI